jgi:hypothetical protein
MRWCAGSGLLLDRQTDESINNKKIRIDLNRTFAEGKKRADYISAEQKRLAAAGTGDAFDTKVAEIISAEAKRPC